MGDRAHQQATTRFHLGGLNHHRHREVLSRMGSGLSAQGPRWPCDPQPLEVWHRPHYVGIGSRKLTLVEPRSTYLRHRTRPLVPSFYVATMVVVGDRNTTLF